MKYSLLVLAVLLAGCASPEYPDGGAIYCHDHELYVGCYNVKDGGWELQTAPGHEHCRYNLR